MRTFKFKLLMRVQRTPNLKEVKRKLNAAVKGAVNVETWAFDGRVTLVWMVHDTDDASSKACHAQIQVVKRPNNIVINLDHARIPIMEAVGKLGWVDADAPNDDTDFEAAEPVVEPLINDSADFEETTPVDDTAETVETVQEPPPPPPPPINVDRGTFFDHLFDREAQIEILYSAIKAAVDSDFQSRFHTVLLGPPGSGKTDLLRSVQAMLGDVHVLLLNGPSTTKAGAEQILMTLDRIQPFVLIEEIEKMHPAHMQWLLGLLDERGEVRRTNARDGHHSRDAKVLCIATINDQERFLGLMHGALASRFSHEIYCPRPSSDVLQRIALREIEKVGGNPYWADPAVKYCTLIEGSYDPRRIVSVCLSGRDELLEPGIPDPNAQHTDAPGRYQQALINNKLLRDEAAKETK